MSDWRIDELAQRAGVAVDTIRYYQREGLLAERRAHGRTVRFGPEHLERLERIRGAAGRAASRSPPSGRSSIMTAPGVARGAARGAPRRPPTTTTSCVEAAGVDADLVRGLTERRAAP